MECALGRNTVLILKQVWMPKNRCKHLGSIKVNLKKVRLKINWPQMYSNVFRQLVSKCYSGRGQAVTV